MVNIHLTGCSYCVVGQDGVGRKPDVFSQIAELKPFIRWRVAVSSCNHKGSSVGTVISDYESV